MLADRMRFSGGKEGDVWVAVGYGGQIAYSTDTINWNELSSGTTENLNSVAFSGERWMIVGDNNTILISENGINWSSIPYVSDNANGTYGLNSLIYGNGKWLCVPRTTINSSPLISEDGVYEWHQVAIPSVRLENCIAFNSLDRFLALIQASGTSNDRYPYYSSDGYNWSSYSPSNFSTSQTYELKSSGSGIWVAVGGGGQIRTSTNNGSSWTSRSSGLGTKNITCVAYNGVDMWVACTMDGFITTSSNGTSWSSQGNVFSGADIRRIAADGEKWVAVSFDGKIFNSDNGLEWLMVNDSVFNGQRIRGIASSMLIPI